MHYSIRPYYIFFASTIFAITCYTRASDAIQKDSIGTVNSLGVTKGCIEIVDSLGVITGYISQKGHVEPIEVIQTPGTGELCIYGGSNEESAHAAYDYIKENAHLLGIEQDILEHTNLHIYNPHDRGKQLMANIIPTSMAMIAACSSGYGAIVYGLLAACQFGYINFIVKTPQSTGSSAGITTATAILSVLAKQPIDKTYAMTGAIDPQGNVTDIGGLLDKILAAKEHGIKNVIIPAENMPDLLKIHPASLEGMNIIPVKNAKEVFERVLLSQQKQNNATLGTKIDLT